MDLHDLPGAWRAIGCAESVELDQPGTFREFERLAARFAAKEAVLKVLRPADGVSVRDIEVGADGSGAPSVRLAGAALAQANAIGLADGTVSLSHDGQYAMAVYAAVLTTPTPLREDHP